MKTITLSVEDAVYEQSRIIAAEHKTTLASLVAGCLEDLTAKDQHRRKAREEIVSMISTFDGKVGRMPSREERNACG